MRHQSERQTEGGDGELELRFSQSRERDTQHAHTNKQGIHGPFLFKASNVIVMRSCTLTRKWIGRNFVLDFGVLQRSIHVRISPRLPAGDKKKTKTARATAEE